MIDWKEVDPRNFEKFIYHALKIVGFKNREWFGRGGGDQGRDVLATWYEELPFDMGYQRKWIFQCKRWRRMPSQGSIYEEISKAAQHSPDHWVMVIPLDPTSSVIDYLSNFKISMNPLSQLEEIVNEHPELVNILINGNLISRSESVED